MLTPIFKKKKSLKRMERRSQAISSHIHTRFYTTAHMQLTHTHTQTPSHTHNCTREKAGDKIKPQPFILSLRKLNNQNLKFKVEQKLLKNCKIYFLNRFPVIVWQNGFRDNYFNLHDLSIINHKKYVLTLN